MIVTRKYCVAKVGFELRMEEQSPFWDSLTNYSPFENNGCSVDFSLEVVPELATEGKELVYGDNPEAGMPVINLYRIGKDWLFEMAPLSTFPICGRLRCDESFTKAQLTIEKSGQFLINNALMILYSFRSADMGNLEMHSSVVVRNGKGYMFLGKSGTGKSTHSSLWLKNVPGTHLLNDDNPVVRVEPDGRIAVYGTPWSGKTPCYRNESASVGAIVRLTQAPHNRIKRLSTVESYASIYSSTSGFKADRRIADGLYETISQVAVNVPCFSLECLPDDDAAMVCSKEVIDE